MFSCTSGQNGDFLTKKGCFFSTPTMNIKDGDQVPAGQKNSWFIIIWFGTFFIFHSIWDNPSH